MGVTGPGRNPDLQSHPWGVLLNVSLEQVVQTNKLGLPVFLVFVVWEHGDAAGLHVSVGGMLKAQERGCFCLEAEQWSLLESRIGFFSPGSSLVALCLQIQMDPQLCLSVQLLFHHGRPEQQHHYCRRGPVDLPLHPTSVRIRTPRYPSSSDRFWFCSWA